MIVVQTPERLAQPRPFERSSSRARFRGVAEFLLVGGLTPVLFPLAWILRRLFGLDASELAVGFLMFHAAFVINDPHFAVTYLLFYRRGITRAFSAEFNPAQRARYFFAGVIVPLMLGVWAIASLAARSAPALGWLIQLMFLLVGWHYVKQGFGVMTVLASRRGVRFASRERLAILAHCFAGWAYAWASPADLGTEVEEKGIVYTTFAHPLWLERLMLVAFLSTAIVLLAVLVRKWRREGPLPLMTPLLALLCSIWSWSIYSNIDPLVVYVIPALHSLQYLYFVWLLKGSEAREREGPPWFETSASVRLGILTASALGLGWVLFHGAPSALDELLVPGRARRAGWALGPTPCFAALYAFVNVHHFFMDNVIWRGDNPEMRYLRPSTALADPRPS